MEGTRVVSHDQEVWLEAVLSWSWVGVITSNTRMTLQAAGFGYVEQLRFFVTRRFCGFDTVHGHPDYKTTPLPTSQTSDLTVIEFS